MLRMRVANDCHTSGISFPFAVDSLQGSRRALKRERAS
jgi:hypothetical protein